MWMPRIRLSSLCVDHPLETRWARSFTLSSSGVDGVSEFALVPVAVLAQPPHGQRVTGCQGTGVVGDVADALTPSAVPRAGADVRCQPRHQPHE